MRKQRHSKIAGLVYIAGLMVELEFEPRQLALDPSAVLPLIITVTADIY